VRRRAIGWVLSSVLVLAAGSTMPGSAADVVEILLHGTYFSEPATVRFVVAVEPHEANRVLWIEADSADLYRGSEIALSGKGEKRLHSMVRRMAPVSGSMRWILRSRYCPTHRLPSAQASPESLPLPGAGIDATT